MFHWNELGYWRVRAGETIEYEHLKGPTEVHRMVLIGRCIPAILHQRRRLVIHASVVASRRGDAAVAFVGASGRGKSTTAASFARAGWPLLSDDLLVCDDDGKALPGATRIKLCATSAAAMSHSPLPPLHEAVPERYYETPVAEAPAPLAAIFLLETKDAPQIEPLGQREACVELLRNTLQPALIDDTSKATRHLADCADLARRVPVSRLCVPRDFNRLADVRELVARSLGL